MTSRPLTLALAVLPALPALPVLHAEEARSVGPPPAYVIRTARQWMQSTDSRRRQAAYRSMHVLGTESLPAFEKALRAALQYHQSRLTKVLNDRHNRANPYPDVVTTSEELRSERERVLKLIRTDYQKDPDKVRMLRSELESLEDLHRRTKRLARRDTSSIDAEIDSIATAIAEIRDELDRFSSAPGQDPPEPLSRERKLEVLRQTFDGQSYLKAVQLLESLRTEARQLESANRDNVARTWARPAQKQFAELLNSKRAVLGLSPLRLEEKLSDAACSHSSDMRRLDFFSHTSPVIHKKSAGDRARKAGFRGRWSGENIFMGSASPVAAYDGWFASDGHRFIMFADGPNVMGVGPVASHWTLMTGHL